MLELVPIWSTEEMNRDIASHEACGEIINMTINYYKIIGFNPPWIGYIAIKAGKAVGTGGFKGGPLNNKIEIAYHTFENARRMGVGTEICQQLVSISLAENPGVMITARTLPEHNYSTRILQKNSFAFINTVIDPDDGEVWEWYYQKNNPES